MYAGQSEELDRCWTFLPVRSELAASNSHPFKLNKADNKTSG
jgi:hypothetical protein